MTDSKRYLSLVLFLALMMVSLHANYRFFQEVQKTAEAYRVECSTDQMKLVADAKGEEVFYITLKSNRNNYEMVMLVGYIAAGQAMKTGVEPKNVYVAVDIPLGEGFRVLTMATREDILRLISGEIKTAQFVRLIQYF